MLCDIWVDYNEIDTIDHKLAEGAKETAATCEVDGKKEGKCTMCGQAMTEVIPMLGGVHDWWKEVKRVAPTCEKEGYRVMECKACGANKEETADPAHGHAMDYSLYNKGYRESIRTVVAPKLRCFH